MNRIKFYYGIIAAFFLCFLVTSSKLIAFEKKSHDNERIYDVYHKGIRVGEFKITEEPNSAIYTITNKNIHTNQWELKTTTIKDSISALTNLQLWKEISKIPSQIQGLQKINWSSLTAVGWPDENSIYVQSHELNETVESRKVTAFYWANRDSHAPVDFIFDVNNQFVAGISAYNDICIVLRGYENFTTVKNWSEPEISAANYGVRKLGKFMVEMSDGIKLATLVYLPNDRKQKSYPVIFIRTPYGIGNLINAYWHYCSRGYAVVLQACRGTIFWDVENKSEGVFEYGVNEPKDGKEALEWITKQTWCNGNIGMQGASYLGYTQWTCSMADNPALKCIIPESCTGTVFSDMQYMGGGFVEGYFFYTCMMTNAAILPDKNWNEIFRHRPLIEIDQFATGKDIPFWNNMVEHWIHDDYWKKQDFYNLNIDRNFSSFQISGWFDDDFIGTRRNWELAQKKANHQPHRLLIGPWKHRYNKDRHLNGYHFGLDALRDDVWILKQKWYDHFLKNIDNDVKETVVEYFVLGENKWRTSLKWPPQNAQFQKWYFHSQGKAHKNVDDGILSTTPPDKVEPADTYQYDPDDPAPNWMSFEQLKNFEDVQSFPYDFKDIESRHDVVVFTSGKLNEDLVIAGDINIVLYASTDVLDTDWWINLSDVYPDGQSVRLTTGMLRARFRNLDDKQHHIFGSNFEKEELLSGNSNEIVRYEISIPAIANRFKKGHKIRIAVMNACEGYSFSNSNTGEHEGYVTNTVVGTMSIHHDKEHASHVILPVLPE